MRWRKKMKKRLFALATAVVMTLSMGMTAMAAPSPSITGPLAGKFAESATAVINGETVALKFNWTLSTKNFTQEQKDSLAYYLPTGPIEAGDKEAEQRLFEKQDERARELFEKVMGYRDENVVASDMFGLSLPAGYTMPSEGVDVTINAPYAGKGDYTYYIFHCKADGTWEYIPTTEGKGTLSGRFMSFSPVFIMRIPKGQVTENPSNTEQRKQEIVINSASGVTSNTATIASTNSNKTTAPKTGDFTGIYVAGMLIMLSVAGIVICIKKQREQA